MLLGHRPPRSSSSLGRPAANTLPHTSRPFPLPLHPSRRLSLTHRPRPLSPSLLLSSALPSPVLSLGQFRNSGLLVLLATQRRHPRHAQTPGSSARRRPQQHQRSNCSSLHAPRISPGAEICVCVCHPLQPWAEQTDSLASHHVCLRKSPTPARSAVVASGFSPARLSYAPSFGSGLGLHCIWLSTVERCFFCPP